MSSRITLTFEVTDEAKEDLLERLCNELDDTAGISDYHFASERIETTEG